MKGKLGALAMAASALFLGRPLAQSVAPSGPPEVTVLPKPGVGGFKSLSGRLSSQRLTSDCDKLISDENGWGMQGGSGRGQYETIREASDCLPRGGPCGCSMASKDENSAGDDYSRRALPRASPTREPVSGNSARRRWVRPGVGEGRQSHLDLFGGPAAQQRFRPSSWRSHHGQFDHGLAVDIALSLNGDGETATAYLKWAELRAAQIIAAHWGLVVAVAERLLRETVLDQSAIADTIEAEMLASIANPGRPELRASN